mmetsp:Transcript_57716/g.118055  ORF Transcript_57716/g.118055 Transcript_57716/m.118055 type:complete len:319 (+) Transcript_57716:76-1032(+)
MKAVLEHRLFDESALEPPRSSQELQDHEDTHLPRLLVGLGHVPRKELPPHLLLGVREEGREEVAEELDIEVEQNFHPETVEVALDEAMLGPEGLPASRRRLLGGPRRPQRLGNRLRHLWRLQDHPVDHVPACRVNHDGCRPVGERRLPKHREGPAHGDNGVFFVVLPHNLQPQMLHPLVDAAHELLHLQRLDGGAVVACDEERLLEENVVLIVGESIEKRRHVAIHPALQLGVANEVVGAEVHEQHFVQRKPVGCLGLDGGAIGDLVAGSASAHSLASSEKWNCIRHSEPAQRGVPAPVPAPGVLHRADGVELHAIPP